MVDWLLGTPCRLNFLIILINFPAFLEDCDNSPKFHGKFEILLIYLNLSIMSILPTSSQTL